MSSLPSRVSCHISFCFSHAYVFIPCSLTDTVMVEGWDTHCVDCAAIAKRSKKYSGRPDSAKIRMIMDLLREIDERSNREEKTIIFSQFTSMLDLIEPFLKEQGILFVRCECSAVDSFAVSRQHPKLIKHVDDGRMSKAHREESLEKIRTSKRTRCILISFKAGSSGRSCCDPFHA